MLDRKFYADCKELGEKVEWLRENRPEYFVEYHIGRLRDAINANVEWISLLFGAIARDVKEATGRYMALVNAFEKGTEDES